MDIFSEMICGYTIFSKRVNKNCTQSVVNCRKKKSSSLHHLFQVINNNVFKTTFPLDHHAIIIAILNVMIVIIQSSWRLEEIPTTPTTYFKGNIILHNLDSGRLKSCHLYYSRVLGLGILPSKSLHICSCHSQQQDCHQCFSTEKTTQEFHINEFSPQKNAENPLSKMGPTTIFGKLNFIMPNIAQFFLRCDYAPSILQKWKSKNISWQVPIHFVIHDYKVLMVNEQKFRSTYLTSREKGHKKGRFTTNYLVSTQQTLNHPEK